MLSSSVFLVLALGTILSGCSAAGSSALDAAIPLRDGRLSDGGLIFADARTDSSSRDSSAADSGQRDSSSGEDVGFPFEAGTCLGFCSPFEQNCSSDVENVCSVAGRYAECTNWLGTVGLHESCRDRFDCQPGLACFATAGEEGRCEKPCCVADANQEAGECPEDTRCEQQAVLIGNEATSFGRCRPTRSCELIYDGSTCDPGLRCYPNPQTRMGECLQEGQGNVGEPCEAINDCSNGLVCLGVSSKACERLCVVGAACNDGSACIGQAFLPAGVGVCTS